MRRLYRALRDTRRGAVAAGVACLAFASPVTSVAGAAEGQAFRITPEMAQQIQGSVDLLINREVEKAAAAVAALTRQDPAELIVPFLSAFPLLMEAEEKEDPRPVLDLFSRRMTSVIERAEALRVRDPKNPDLLLLLGLAWGSRALSEGAQKNYLATFEAVKASHRFFTETLTLALENADAHYGLGLYDYTLSELPALLKPFVSLLFPVGSRERGLSSLRLAAEKGVFTRPLAQVVLLQVAVREEDGRTAALPLAEDLDRRYPGNPDIAFLTALIFSEAGEYEKARAVAERIGSRIAAGDPRFPREMEPRHLQLLGKIHMDRGFYPEALTFFERAIDRGNARYAWVTAWAWTRRGMVYDLVGNREEAVRSYRQALEVKTEGIAREAAERYLERPYRKGDKPRG